MLLSKESNLIFYEQQRFNQWWIFLPIVLIALIPIYGIVQQVIFQQDFGDKPVSDTALFVVLCIPLAILLLLRGMKLVTKIDDTGIHITYRPFVNRHLRWSDITDVSLIQYAFVGFGIRYLTSYGTVYNVRGNQGLHIKLKNGKKILVGTQQATKLHQYLSANKTFIPTLAQNLD